MRQPEIAALRKVHHRNVLRLHKLLLIGGAGGADASVLLVSELLDADLFESLEAMHLRARHPGPEHVRWLGRELLSGLAAIHGSGVLHRDLKPENVMIAGAGAPGGAAAKLVDFGQAKDTRIGRARRGDWTAYTGTRWYRAPELLLGAARYTAAVDVWSCALVLAEALTGRPVMPGTSPGDQLFKIAATLGPPQAAWPQSAGIAAAAGVSLPSSAGRGAGVRSLLPPGTPSPLVEALESMLRWDPASRPTAAECLALPFFASGPCEPLEPGKPPAKAADRAGDALRRRAASDEQARLVALAAKAAKAGPRGGAAAGTAAAAAADSDTDDDFADDAAPADAAPVPTAPRTFRAPGAAAAATTSRRPSGPRSLGLSAPAGAAAGAAPARQGRAGEASSGLGSTLSSILGGPAARPAAPAAAPAPSAAPPAEPEEPDEDFDDYVPSFG